MADEGTTIRTITYGDGVSGLSQQQVIDAIRESSTRNEQLQLHLPFLGGGQIYNQRFRFDATVEMQNAIVEDIVHIESIKIQNPIKEKNEHKRCLNFFVRVVQESNGKIKNFEYISFINKCDSFPYEWANQLANAIRSNYNNNNNGAIESFTFHDYNLNYVSFQPLWDVLLNSNVRKIKLGNSERRSNDQNDTINFTGLITNTSIKELNLLGYKMSTQNQSNLFHAIAANKRLEKLSIDLRFRDGDVDGYGREDGPQHCVKKMLRTNISLLDVNFLYCNNHDVRDLIIQIKIQTQLNRMWKRYIMKREEEKKASAATAVAIAIAIATATATATAAGTSTRTTTTTSPEEVDNDNEKEKKKKFKLRLLFHVFHKKPVFLDSILFHLLSEYPDDLIGIDGQNQNQMLLHSIESNFTT